VAKCPMCDELILHLKLYEEAEVLYDLGATQEGEPTFVKRGVIVGEGSQTIECPRCQVELFNDQEKAAQWLVGKIEWEPPEKVPAA